MKSKKINIIGIGIGGVSQISLRSNSLLASSEKVFSLVTNRQFPLYLETLNQQTEDLIQYYKPNRTADEIYNGISNHIINSGISENWEEATFVVEGNPQLYNIPVKLLKKKAIELDWNVKIHPAISSLDTILIDLDLQIEELGVQIFDAPRMMINKQKIQNNIPCLILQIANCNNNHFSNIEKQSPEDYLPLKNWLLNFYPESHEVVIVNSAMSEDLKPVLKNGELGKFIEFSSFIDYNSTLYIPNIKNED